jgi:DNA polymerase I-like protein with 3'-5' exonuclease and polymerase domains
VQSEEVMPALMGIEMPLVPVLVAMEATGIALSPDILQQQRPPMLRRLQQLERAAAELAGGVSFNLSAPSEVSKVLFEKLKLPPPPQATAG